MQGRGECPFAGNCFYLHAYPDGRIAELPPPQARRRRTNQHGEYDVLAVSIVHLIYYLKCLLIDMGHSQNLCTNTVISVPKKNIALKL